MKKLSGGSAKSSERIFKMSSVFSREIWDLLERQWLSWRLWESQGTSSYPAHPIPCPCFCSQVVQQEENLKTLLILIIYGQQNPQKYHFPRVFNELWVFICEWHLEKEEPDACGVTGLFLQQGQIQLRFHRAPGADTSSQKFMERQSTSELPGASPHPCEEERGLGLVERRSGYSRGTQRKLWCRKSD